MGGEGNSQKDIWNPCVKVRKQIHYPGCSAPLVKFRLDSFTKGWDSWELEDMEKKAPVREKHTGVQNCFQPGTLKGLPDATDGLFFFFFFT